MRGILRKPVGDMSRESVREDEAQARARMLLYSTEATAGRSTLLRSHRRVVRCDAAAVSGARVTRRRCAESKTESLFSSGRDAEQSVWFNR